MKSILVTGGAGFIGSAVVRALIEHSEAKIIVFDKLTYAGNLSSLKSVLQNPRFVFIRSDICDRQAVKSALITHHPDVIMHLAAESHVDRSIDGPAAFINTNIVGTFVMLDEALRYYRSLSGAAAKRFRFMHISTDEVFGSLGEAGLFHEKTPYAPNSPYSATKAGSDHLVRAWGHTYDLPVIITNCSNNYGPYQFPEKLIPLMIINAIERKPLPVYGTGNNIRDWLYVEDHAAALIVVAQHGLCGETYNIGGRNEWRNIEVVRSICDVFNEFFPFSLSYYDLITHVPDRPGHDLRYAIDSNKIERELGWVPTERFDTGLRKTVKWYLENTNWWQSIRDDNYNGNRLGLQANSTLNQN